MKKYFKWGLVALLIIGSVIFGCIQLMPKENEELAMAEAKPKGGKKVLEVSARVISPQLLTD